MHRGWAFVLLLTGFPTYAVTVKGRSCAGGIEAAKIRVDVRRAAGGEPRSLSRVKVIEKGAKVTYAPVELPEDLRKNARVALVVAPSESGSEVPSSLTILEFKSAAANAEWTVPFRAGLAVFALGPQGLDEKRVNTLMARDNELITALADYAEQTAEIESTVEELTAIAEEEDTEFDEAASRLDRSNPSEQALYTLLRALNPTLISGNPMGAGKRVGPVTMANKASVGFFENAGGLFPGGGALTEIKPLLFPDTEFRAAFVQHVGESLALCVPRTARTRNRQVYIWARRIIDAPVPAYTLNGKNIVPMGARSALPVKASRQSDWRYADRVDRWSLVAANQTIPVRVRPSGQGRALELDLRGFNGKAGRYKLHGAWDWDAVQVAGEVDVLPPGDLTQARATPVPLNDATATVTLEGTDFQFVEKVTLRRAGGQADLAQPVQFVLPQGRRGGIQQRMDVEIDTRGLVAGGYLLAVTQAGGRPQDIALELQRPAPRIEVMPVRIASDESAQRVVLRGAGVGQLRGVELAGAEVRLDPPGRDSSERVAWIQLKPGARRGERLDLLFSFQGAEQKSRQSGVVEVTGARPKIVSFQGAAPADLGVALKEGELPAGSLVSFSLQTENMSADGSLRLACEQEKGLVVRMRTREQGASLSRTGANALFLSFDPGVIGPSGCAITAILESADGTASEAKTLGRVVRLPRIASFTFTGEKNSDGTYAAILTGQDLETIEKTGWESKSGMAVGALPAPVAGQNYQQTLRVSMPWPSPAPRSPLYIWLRGEAEGRATTAKY